MSRGFEQITILGSLGRKPEVQSKVGHRESFLAKLSVAVGRLDQHGNPETTWYNVEAWDELGETCARFLDKSSQVLVVGVPRLVSWTGDDRVHRSRIMVRALNVTFVGSRRKPDVPMTAGAAPAAVGAPPTVPATLRGSVITNKEAEDGDDYVGGAFDDDASIGSGLGFVDDDAEAFGKKGGAG